MPYGLLSFLPRETPMDTTKSLLERLRSKYDGCSDYRLAKILGIGKTAVSRYTAHGEAWAARWESA